MKSLRDSCLSGLMTVQRALALLFILGSFLVPATTFAVDSLPVDGRTYDDIVKELVRCVYGCDYEMAANFYQDNTDITGTLVPYGLYTDLHEGMVCSELPYAASTSASGFVEVVNVHIHPLHVFGDPDYGTSGLSEEEREKVCSGEQIPPRMQPSHGDVDTFMNSAAYYDPVRVTFIVYDPGGYWTLGIGTYTPFIRWWIDDENTPGGVDPATYGITEDYYAWWKAVLDATFGYSLILANPTSIAERDRETNRIITGARALGFSLTYTPNAYTNGGATIPDCVTYSDYLGDPTGTSTCSSKTDFLESVFGAVSCDTSGLVPCCGPDCNACHLVELAQRILKWLIGFAILVGTILIAWGGLRMATSAGDPGGVEAGKRTITNVLVGLLILLMAWLIIDTIMKQFVDGAKLGPWSEIECVDQPRPTSATARNNLNVQFAWEASR